MQHALDAQASDYVMPDVMKIGGVSGWLRAAALAQARGIRVSNHLWPEISAQLLCVTPTAHWLEYADWWNPILGGAALGRSAAWRTWRCARHRRGLGRGRGAAVLGLAMRVGRDRSIRASGRRDRRAHARALRRARRRFLGRHARARRQPERRGAAAAHRGRAAVHDPRLRLRARARSQDVRRARPRRDRPGGRRALRRDGARLQRLRGVAAGLPAARSARRAASTACSPTPRCSTCRAGNCRACCASCTRR